MQKSDVLPKIFCWLALFIGVLFAALGVVFLFHLILPIWVTAIAGIQAFWWLASSIVVIVRAGNKFEGKKGFKLNR